MSRAWQKWRRIAFALALTGLAGAAPAQTQILLVTSDSSAAYREVAEAMRAVFAAQPGAFEIKNLAATELAGARQTYPQADFIVAVGTAAMEQASQEMRVPVLNILVPRQSYESLRLRTKLDPRQFSAIYLDQPLSRQLELIRAALPEREALGVLLGPTAQERIKPLQQAAREQKFTLAAEPVHAESDIIPALKRLTGSANVLLALPDPLVFNKNTAQNLLLTSYRAQIPLIAYSKSYVGAGALAAVYSSPAQIAQQAAETLLRLVQAKPSSLPGPQYPKYYSVNVNYQVARSLGLVIEDEAVLLQRIKAGTERE